MSPLPYLYSHPVPIMILFSLFVQSICHFYTVDVQKRMFPLKPIGEDRSSRDLLFNRGRTPVKFNRSQWILRIYSPLSYNERNSSNKVGKWSSMVSRSWFGGVKSDLYSSLLVSSTGSGTGRPLLVDGIKGPHNSPTSSHRFILFQ